MKDTRVKSAHQRNTPVAGSPKHLSAKMKTGTRVAKAPSIKRSEPPHSSQSAAQKRMGLSIGSRVSSKLTK